MAIKGRPLGEPAKDVMRECARVLQRLAEYRLPPALDRRLLWLSENKEWLCDEDREELLASVEFVQDRTAEKVQAQALLERLTGTWPDLVG